VELDDEEIVRALQGLLDAHGVEYVERLIGKVTESAPLRKTSEAHAKVVDLENRLKQAEKLCRDLIQQRNALQEALEAEQQRSTASQNDREVKGLQKRLQEMSQTMKRLMEERDKLKEEADSARRERDAWLKTEYNTLKNELHVLKEENQAFRRALSKTERAIQLLRLIASLVRELDAALDATTEPWSADDQQQGKAAYEELAEAWERVKQPLDLALNGIPPGLTLFDQFCHDADRRELAEEFLANHPVDQYVHIGKPARSNIKARMTRGTSTKRKQGHVNDDGHVAIEDPEELAQGVQALEREWEELAHTELSAVEEPDEEAD
jgi:hypothetical protein